MNILWTVGGLIAFLVAGNLLSRALRSRRRARAARLPVGVQVLRQAIDAPARIFANQRLPGGLRGTGINRGEAIVILGSDQLIVATRHGRVLSADGERAVTVRSPGPRQLVLEGEHPVAQAPVRVELIVDDAPGWAREISARCAVAP